MDVTELGIVIEVIAVHPWNAFALMLPIVLGIVMLVKPAQFINTAIGIDVRPAGSGRLVSPLHPKNAYVPIVVTVEGIVKVVNPAHPYRAYWPIEVNPEGTFRLVREEHP
jgi:hypothetical protein